MIQCEAVADGVDDRAAVRAPRNCALLRVGGFRIAPMSVSAGSLIDHEGSILESLHKDEQSAQMNSFVFFPL